MGGKVISRRNSYMRPARFSKPHRSFPGRADTDHRCTFGRSNNPCNCAFSPQSVLPGHILCPSDQAFSQKAFRPPWNGRAVKFFPGSVSSGFLTAWETVRRTSDHGTYSFPMCSAVRIFFFFSPRLCERQNIFSQSRGGAETGAQSFFYF